jgi:hypothetical protein
MAPFLLIHGKIMISNIIKPHIDNIVKYYTDNFITKVKFDYKQPKSNYGQIFFNYIKLKKEIGNIKYESYCLDVKIYHNNKVKGIFTL